MKTRLTCFVCALLLVFMFGCQTGKSGWEFNAETLGEVTNIVETLHFYYVMQVEEHGEGTIYGENVLTSDKIKLDYAADYFRWSTGYDDSIDYSKMLKSDAVRVLNDTLGTNFSEEFLDNGSDYFDVPLWGGDYYPYACVGRVETDGDRVTVHGTICWSGNIGLGDPRGFTATFKADKIQLISLDIEMTGAEMEEMDLI